MVIESDKKIKLDNNECNTFNAWNNSSEIINRNKLKKGYDNHIFNGSGDNISGKTIRATTIYNSSALKMTTTEAVPTETAIDTKTIVTSNTLSNRKLSREMNEKSSLSKLKQEKILSYSDLFRFATTFEIFLTLFGVIFASLTSCGLPYSIIIYGEFSTLLVDRSVGTGTSTETSIVALFGGGRILTNATAEENRIALLEDSRAYGIGSLVGAIIHLILSLISIDLINYSALKQINRIRKLFLRAVLRQDMAWYDTNTTNNFAARITDDLDKIKEGIGEKLAIFIYLMMSFIISVALSLFYGWKLTLAVLSCSPIIILATAFVAKMQSTLAEKELQSYASAGSVAEEVLSSIRTVIAFGGEEKEALRYKNRLRPAEITGQRKGLFSGIGGGIMWFIIYCSYALAFWYGVKLILHDRILVDKEYTPAVLVIVLFGVLAGAQNLGLTSPHLEAFATARGAASVVYSVIERLPIIDSLSEFGLYPKLLIGDIDLENVHFRYPARSDVKVLQGLNLSIKSGQTVALVGSSGCGKSTCLQLIQRLYDPLHGCVKVDGIKVTELNTRWLRSHIGVVGQEPVLFATTIGENIRYSFPEATQEEIENSAKIANCHDFIVKLPNGYNTMVGERGAQLSGGQKQRIAIARALVRNPRILLLDEATSALDPQSERKVQKALEKASKGRTTLVVSHRLSTITNADKIIYIDKGVIVEAGTHSKLMEINGLYKHLVDATNSTPNGNIKDHSKFKKTRNIIKKPDSITKSISNKTCEESSSSDEEQESESNEDIVEKEHVYSVSAFRLIKMNSKEWPYIVIGCAAAMAVGSSFPIFAIIFGEFYGILSIQDPEEVYKESLIFSILFIVLGIVTGLGTFLQTYLFNIAGVRLTSRLRQTTFKTMMKQEIGWFDESKNAVGALCARLSGDCASVQGATGSRIGSILQASSTLVFGTAISLYYSWKLTAVSILSVPLVLAAVFFESRYMETSNIEEKKAMEGTTKIAVEAISNIRTVASLGQEPHVLNRYLNEMESVEMACRRKVRFRGTVFSLGQTAPFFGYGLALFYGGIMVANEGLEYKNVIKVSEALIFGAWMLGQALAYAPNVNSAIVSAGRIMQILDRKPKMNDLMPPLENKVNYNCNGNVHYTDIKFRYPTRPGIQVLQGLNLNVKKGQTVALVGPSGCGKSTCIQLLLRYYDPDEGFVKLDDKKVIDLPSYQLRSQLGLVSQEPVLFDRSIAENIAYGDNGRQIPISEIIEVAKMSNIHEFIISLPQGYETNVGSKASQLSGGQKQRIAIARALVRNPKILLLDEATSALDTQSEKVVQEALDFARQGRTCIVIAHRLTTIQNVDTICVLQDGIITEKGTHDELMTIGKFYANLYSMQQVI